MTNDFIKLTLGQQRYRECSTSATPPNRTSTVRATGRSPVNTYDFSEMMEQAFKEGLWAGWNSGMAGETMDDIYAHGAWDASDACVILRGGTEERIKALEAFVREYVRAWEAGTGTVYLIAAARNALGIAVRDYLISPGADLHEHGVKQ